MSNRVFYSALSATLALAVCAVSAQAADTKIVLKNQSKWALHELYINTSKSDDWGPDQLKQQVVKHGEQFTLSGIPCDKYDVKVVDEDGDQCVVENVALCGTADVWTITDADLLKCQAASTDK